jgi:hypothetical protein
MPVFVPLESFVSYGPHVVVCDLGAVHLHYRSDNDSSVLFNIRAVPGTAVDWFASCRIEIAIRSISMLEIEPEV